MMKKGKITDIFAVVLAAVAVVLLVVAFSFARRPGDTRTAAQRVERKVARRVAMLENYMQHPADNIPSDMVIYRYVQDTLVSWYNQFPVYNDDLNSRMMFQSINNPAMNFVSPLSEITDSLTFKCLSDSWYLVKKVDDGYNTVIGGLEIMKEFDNTSFNGVNPKLGLGENFSIKQLSASGGDAVNAEGRPQFKVHYDSLAGNVSADFGLIWIAFALLVAAAFMYLESRRTLKAFGLSAAVMSVFMAAMYIWSVNADFGMKIFSPVLYAGGPVLHSLGSVVIINLAILLLVGGLYIVRKDIADRVRKTWGVVLSASFCLLIIAGILIYSHFALRSIIMNSNISLELYKLENLSVWSVIVYLSFLTLLLTIPMLLQMLQPAMTKLLGKHMDFLSRAGRVVYSILVAVYLVLLTSVLGFHKEQGKVEVWSNMLSVDRDLSLELQLRGVEFRLADDVFIASLAVLDNGESSIRRMITDNYMAWISRNYNINVIVANESSTRRRGDRRAEMINRRIMEGGEPIAENSRFMYCESQSGQSSYVGVFNYIHEQYGFSRVMVEVQPKATGRERGYASLLGISAPGRFNLPSEYSYARYKDRTMDRYRGNYPYPAQMEDSLYEDVYVNQTPVVKMEGYVHFCNIVSDNEAIFISRPKTPVAGYLVSTVFIAIVAFFLCALLLLGKRKKTVFETGYYKTRITWMVMVALFLTLVVMALASAIYVYHRNEVNLNTLMSDKIISIQSMLQEEMLSVRGPQDFRNPQRMNVMETVADNTNSDINLYSPDGRMVFSTFRETYETLPLGSRMDRKAYENIVEKGRRYYINKEMVGGVSCYVMYAPVFGPNNRLITIMSSPYTGGETNVLEMDAFRHLFTIFTVFLLLLLLARVALSSVLNRMFTPLKEMGSKMNNAGINTLEYIDYTREDEISSVVQAYNRMVTDLSESTRKLAQAERDKAWSGMARQVAHEIKNPLTPMKLQLQRIIRLKERGDEGWQDKFDEVSKVLLDHIDILTDTANEFSTFAKLYTEEHTVFDLDKVLQEEIAMFDNRENITFNYFGFQGTKIKGPKPQLTRVFVNLINNSVQALEGRTDGIVTVSLRNSVTDGYLDIAVEDNGPGVAPENIEKLFTPNFTTKNGGSGLGLAISRSILDRCSATISYSKSFQLGGACFTIQYPRGTV